MLRTIGTYPWSFVTQIFHSGQPSHETCEVMTNLTNSNPDLSSFSYSESLVLNSNTGWNQEQCVFGMRYHCTIIMF